jgi:protein-tyrosine phosphatase
VTDDRPHRWNHDGGVHEIPLPPRATGRLWLCGKHAIGPDPDGLMRRTGTDTVVCLNETEELEDRYPDYVAWLRTQPAGRIIWFPIHDLHAPPLEEYRPLLDDLVERLVGGANLIVHCGAGIGRAGTTAVAVLVDLGVPLDDALATVRRHRPAAGPEVGPQLDLVRRIAEN